MGIIKGMEWSLKKDMFLFVFIVYNLRFNIFTGFLELQNNFYLK